MAAKDVSDGGLGQPAVHAVAVTTHDTNELGYVTRALYVGGAGNVEVVMQGGETVVFSAVPVGAVLPIRVKQVKATGTTATLILALY